MCFGCGNQDHEGRIQYARNSENSPQMMVPPREYLEVRYF